MKRILVTGGAGFIGSHLVPLLAKNGYKVRVLDNLSPQIHGERASPPSWIEACDAEFIYGSVTSKGDIEKSLENVGAIVHLAAETGTGQSMYEIERYNFVNILGTAILLDVIANSDDINIERVLLASSRSVYGEGAYTCADCDDGQRICPEPRTEQQLTEHIWEPVCPKCDCGLSPLPTHETDSINPASIYAATKYAQEDLVKIACTSMNIGYGILRLQNVYGEGQSLNNPYTGILSIFSTKIRKGSDLPIFEDGLETRDFVHVSDVVNAFFSALQVKKAPDSIINVGTGVKTTVSDIASLLNKSFGGDSKIEVTGEYRIGDIRHNCADIGRLEELLNYSPQVRLDQGLQLFSDWVNKQPLPEDRLSLANSQLREKGLMGR